MEDLELDNTNLTCPKLPVDQLLKLLLVYSVTGGVGVLLASTILLALLCARAYKTALQRMVIYTVLTVVVQHSCHLANVLEYHHHATKLEDSRQCAWLGFISNWSGWTEYSFYLIIILYLFGAVCVQVKGVALPLLKIKTLRILIEIGVILLSVFVPALVLWVPMYQNKYGLDNGHCFFKSLCNETESSYFKYIFFYNFIGYEVFSFLWVLIAVVLLTVYCILSSKHQRAKFMIRYLAVLLTAMIVNCFFLNVILVIYTEVPDNIMKNLRVFSAVFATADDFVLLGGFLLAFYSSKLVVVLRKIVPTRRKIQLKEGTDYGTFKESSQRKVPSYTYYESEAPYTGEFTSYST